MKGTIYVLLSAVCFSTGGVLIKSIPWSSITIQGIRSIFSFMLIASYMVITKRKFVWNKTVLFGAVCNTVMALTFVSATKMTTAANAIVLQFTEPIFVILLMWALYKKKPKKAAVVACAVVFAGILCFFLDSLSAGGMAGNLLAVFSGFTYALVMMMKGFPGADFESSLLASHVISLSIGLPSFLGGDRSFCEGMDLYYPSRCDPVWIILHLFIEGPGSCFAGHGILNFYIRADLKSNFSCDLLR